MALSTVTVRPLLPTEYDSQFRLADQTFSASPSTKGVKLRHQFMEHLPGFRPEMLRGAFLEDQYAGGYTIYERELRIGEALLPTGCIGTVVTDPNARKQGIASKMMQDAIDYAQTHHYAFLMLDGIPKFYYRYGYTDVFDMSYQEVERTAIQALPTTPYTIRHATLEDARAVLTLYEHDNSSRTGSFARSLEMQQHYLHYRYLAWDNPLWLAISPSGEFEGYMALLRGEDRWQSSELVADNWNAALALIQHHAHLLDGSEPPKYLRYRLPPESLLLQWLVDHLEATDTSQWRSSVEEWVVLNQTTHHRFAGWMGRIVDLTALLQAMFPEWQARWQRSLASWQGEIHLQVDNTSFTFHLQDRTLKMSTTLSSEPDVRWTVEQFIQVLFGYRMLDWALQTHTMLSAQTRQALMILFPPVRSWIPYSDWF